MDANYDLEERLLEYSARIIHSDRPAAQALAAKFEVRSWGFDVRRAVRVQRWRHELRTLNVEH